MFFSSSQKKQLTEKFNEKWAGRELYFCQSIFSELNLDYSMLRACCSCTMSPYTPPVFYMAENNDFSSLDLRQYFRQLHRIMTWNQTEKSVCSGCGFYKKMTVPYFPLEGNIKLLSINNFSICNSNCVYCGWEDKTRPNSYKLVPVLKKLFNYRLINQSTLVNWGGGEPVICPEFDETAEFFIKRKIKQHINSSGIKFSQFILNGMRKNLASIQISPDAGTSETYLKIKRQNGFFKVWENIQKYAQFPDNLIVKYIIFSMNSNENDIKEFLKLCINSGVKKIVIDAEHKSSFGSAGPFGQIGEKELQAAYLLKHLAIENNLEYTISHQWTLENKQKIEQA